MLGIPKHGGNNFDTRHNTDDHDVIVTLTSHTPPFLNACMCCVIDTFADQLVSQRLNAQMSQLVAMMGKHLYGMWPCSVARALMTSPRADSDLLMA